MFSFNDCCENGSRLFNKVIQRIGQVISINGVSVKIETEGRIKIVFVNMEN